MRFVEKIHCMKKYFLLIIFYISLSQLLAQSSIILPNGNVIASMTQANRNESTNIFSGNIKTDEKGKALVVLTELLHHNYQDFKYQLTVLSEDFAQAVVSKKINQNQFEIKTNLPNIEVSWQVSGTIK